jgi:hypothetical protein
MTWCFPTSFFDTMDRATGAGNTLRGLFPRKTLVIS